MENKTNIIDEAIQESIEYLKKLNVRNHYENLLKKYIEYHNKGIHVHFSFINLKRTDGFKYYAKRYGLSSEVLDLVKDFKLRDIKMQVNKKKEKVENDKRLISRELNQWKIAINKLNAEVDAFKHDREQLFHQASQALKSIFLQKINELKLKQERLEKTVEKLARMERKVKNIHEEFSNSDLQLLRHLVQYFMKIMEEKLSNLFVEGNVKLKYSMREIQKSYLEKKKTGLELYHEDNMSWFESEIVGFLKQVKKMFKIVIEKNGYEYRLTASNSFFVPDIRKKENTPNAESQMIEPMQKFFKKHKGLWLLLHWKATVDKHSGDKEVSNQILTLIHNIYPEKTMQQYFQLSRELNEKLKVVKQQEQKQDQCFFGEAAIQKMKEDFPELYFRHSSKEDENFKFLIEHYHLEIESKYIYYIDEIVYDQFLLKL